MWTAFGSLRPKSNNTCPCCRPGPTGGLCSPLRRVPAAPGSALPGPSPLSAACGCRGGPVVARPAELRSSRFPNRYLSRETRVRHWLDVAGTCSPPLQMCFSFAHDWAQDSVLLFTFIHNSDSAPVTNIRRAPFTESNSNISSRPKFSSWDSRELCMWLINEHLNYGEINPGRSGRRRPPRVALPFVTFCSFLRCSVPVSVTRG